MFHSRTIIAITLLGGAQLTTHLIIIRGLLNATKVKNRDISMKKRKYSFSKRIRKNFLKMYPGQPKKYVEDLLEAMLELQNNDDMASLNGLGGSRGRGVEEILRKYHFFGEES